MVEVYKAKESLAILKSIKPSIKKIGAISPPDKIMKNIFTCILKDIDNGYYEVRGKIEKTLEGWKKSVIEMADSSDAIFLLMPYGLKNHKRLS